MYEYVCSRYEYALVRTFVYQITEGLVGHCKDVWLGLLSRSSTIHVDVFSGIDGQWTVWVDCDEKQARVSLRIVRRRFSLQTLKWRTYIRSDWYRMCKLWITDGSFKWVSSAMSSALSNLAGLTLSTASPSTSCWWPLSHCTKSFPSGSSSITHPRTKAVAGSLSQT